MTAKVRRLEDDLNDSKNAAANLESELDSTLDRLHTVEEQNASLQSDCNKMKGDLDSLLRENDSLKVVPAHDCFKFLLVFFTIQFCFHPSDSILALREVISVVKCKIF